MSRATRVFLSMAAASLLASSLPGRASGSLTITVSDNDLSPKLPKLVAGDTVTWNWTGAGTHRLVAYQGASFDTGDKSTGTFSFVFGGGVVKYRCIYHSTGGYGGNWGGMVGVLTDPPPAITVTSPLRASQMYPSDLYRLFIAPGAGDAVPVKFAGTATDNYSVERVEVEIGGPFCCTGAPTTIHPAQCDGCGTPSASWHVDIDLLPGAYTWRVRAIDGPAGGVGTTGSAWYSLIVA